MQEREKSTKNTLVISNETKSRIRQYMTENIFIYKLSVESFSEKVTFA